MLARLQKMAWTAECDGSRLGRHGGLHLVMTRHLYLTASSYEMLSAAESIVVGFCLYFHDLRRRQTYSLRHTRRRECVVDLG